MTDTWVVTPDTDIELLKLNLQIDNKNQLTFNNREAQEEYFNSLDSYKIEDSTFQRNDSTINVELPFEEMIKYTYCRYKNKNKWYYAFITDVTYENEYMTSARLVTDVWQTYQFDITYGVSFIERCHPVNDSIGAQLIPEELETGEYVINRLHYAMDSPFEYNKNGYYICLESTRNPTMDTLPEYLGGSSNGLPSVIPKYLYQNTDGGTARLFSDIQRIINLSTENVNAIQNVYLVHPLALGQNSTHIPLSTEPILINYQINPNILRFNDNTITDFKYNNDYYKPINKKLLTYPYVYYRVTNGNGSAIIYRQEDFKDNYFQSIIYGVVCAGNNVKLVPTNYKNINDNESETGNARKGVADESLSLGKLPILNWGGDTYTAWLVNNSLFQDTALQKAQDRQVIAGFQVGASAINPLSIFKEGLSTNLANFAEAFTDRVRLEREQLQERYIADLVPPTIGGNKEVGDVNVVSGFTDFCVECMTIKPRQARIIDGYFYKYGYKVNDNDIIKINTHSKFNYIKTIGAVITGDVPQMYLEAIKGMFDNGVTLWHNPDTFMSYSINYNDNPIIG